MTQTTIADDDVIQNIRLCFDRCNEMLILMSKVNLLADICNSTFSGSNHFTKFTPENSAQVIEEYMHILVGFND